MKSLSEVIKNPLVLTVVQLLALGLFFSWSSAFYLLWVIGLIIAAIRIKNRGTRIICGGFAALFLALLVYGWLF